MLLPPAFLTMQSASMEPLLIIPAVLAIMHLAPMPGPLLKQVAGIPVLVIMQAVVTALFPVVRPAGVYL